MHSLLATILACVLAVDALPPQELPVALAPTASILPGDALDFLFALHEFDDVLFVEVVEFDGVLLATVMRLVHADGAEFPEVETTYYAFWSNAYEHSVVTVGFYADEMD